MAIFGFYIGFKCVQTNGHETVFWQANSVSRASTSYFDPLTYQIWIDCFPRWVQNCCHGVNTMAEWYNGINQWCNSSGVRPLLGNALNWFRRLFMIIIERCRLHPISQHQWLFLRWSFHCHCQFHTRVPCFYHNMYLGLHQAEKCKSPNIAGVPFNVSKYFGVNQVVYRYYI